MQKLASIVLAAPLAWLGFTNADATFAAAGFGGVDTRVWLASSDRPRLTAPAPFHATSAGSILARNPFDSAFHPPEAPPEDPATVFDAPVCDRLRVLAIAASDEPSWSLASIREDGEKPMLARRGNVIGHATVAFIGWDRVWMSSGDRLCQSVMFVPASTTPPPPPPVKTQAIPGIDRSGAEIRVDRGVAEKFLANPATLMKEARIAPITDGTRVVAIELRNVRPDGPLAALGIEDGDRLHTINGYDLTDPQMALQAYARLPGASHLTINLTRRGKVMNLDYEIR